jgi:hypothetical protein
MLDHPCLAGGLADVVRRGRVAARTLLYSPICYQPGSMAAYAAIS